MQNDADGGASHQDAMGGTAGGVQPTESPPPPSYEPPDSEGGAHQRSEPPGSVAHSSDYYVARIEEQLEIIAAFENESAEMKRAAAEASEGIVALNATIEALRDQLKSAEVLKTNAEQRLLRLNVAYHRLCRFWTQMLDMPPLDEEIAVRRDAKHYLEGS